ncbi:MULTISPECIES: hypothetical protein [unclassified Bartonella]|uniref:hypothetical protein n=1 Tax=unclassified Bartonella TaxID=2645622 RepID=UPI0015FD93DF|nr:MULTISPECIES: hypothetical protein [unclassified Bartonella]UXN03131.1 hypothetical protein N6B01_11795 [Bartonella sp. HY406]
MSNMTNNSNPNEVFSHPWRGILVLSIYLVISPPLQMLVLVFFDHAWIGGSDLLIEITNVFKQNFVPRLMSSYSLFMAQAVFAGLWCAYGAAQGRALSLGTAITSLVVTGVVIELITQVIVVLVNHTAFIPMLLLIAVVQGIVAGFICWSLARKLKLARPADDIKS